MSSVLSTLSDNDKMILQKKLYSSDSNIAPIEKKRSGEYRITSGERRRETENVMESKENTKRVNYISEMESNIHEEEKNVVYKFYEQFLNKNHNYRRSSNQVLTDKDLFPKVVENDSFTSAFKAMNNKKPVRLGPAAQIST